MCTKGMTVFINRIVKVLFLEINRRFETILFIELVVLFVMTEFCIVNVPILIVHYYKKELFFFGAINVPHSHKQRRKHTPTAQFMLI